MPCGCHALNTAGLDTLSERAHSVRGAAYGLDWAFASDRSPSIPSTQTSRAIGSAEATNKPTNRRISHNPPTLSLGPEQKAKGKEKK